MSWIKLLFCVAGLYDFVIGAGFLAAGPRLFEVFETTPPNHWGYVYFVCLLLMIFAAMFFTVAADPLANRNLIPFGIMLKASYTGIVGYYWATIDVPPMYKPFAIIDAVMLVLFVIAYVRLGERRGVSLP
jgi:hypothetical protein